MTKAMADAPETSAPQRASESLDLYWVPLGAGAAVVRSFGRLYERVAAAIRRRPRCDLYHSALVATTGDGRVFIEMAPEFDNRGHADRGVVATGAVGLKALYRFRVFRYCRPPRASHREAFAPAAVFGDRPADSGLRMSTDTSPGNGADVGCGPADNRVRLTTVSTNGRAPPN